MAYGRLDIYWPDGNFESHMLEAETVSVGRAPGNTIPLDTDTISRYHFSIVHDAETTSLTDLDSQNGTFVDGSRLKSNEKYVLDGAEEIIIGQLRIIYHPVDDQPTVPMNVAGEDTERIESAKLQLDLDTHRLDVWPAASSSAELAITNHGGKAQDLIVKIEGLPREWVRLNHPTQPLLSVMPGETALVLINIKPLRRPNTVPGDYPATIKAYLQDDPEQGVEVPFQVRVNAFSGFGIAMTNKKLDADEELRLYLHNHGSGPLQVGLTFKSPNQALTSTLNAQPVLLAPGQRLLLTGKIEARQRPITGPATTQPFIVEAQAHNASRFVATAQGHIQVEPLLPTWAAISAVGITLAVLAIALLFLLNGVFNPPQPRLLDMAVNSSQIAQGDPLNLSWVAEDAARFALIVDGQTLRDDIPGDARQLNLNTGGYQGVIELTLRAHNGPNVDERRQAIQVYQPMNLERFEVIPQQLVRYVVADLTLVWEVPGAVSVRFDGLDNFSNFPLQSAYEASGRVEGIGGSAETAFSVALVAEDEVGNVLQEARTITLTDPECLALSATELREGPDVRHQVVGRIEANARVVVDAQDANAGWLRTTQSGVQGWAARESFRCDTFNPSALRTLLDVPPPPTNTPIPTRASTNTPAPTPSLVLTPTPDS